MIETVSTRRLTRCVSRTAVTTVELEMSRLRSVLPVVKDGCVAAMARTMARTATFASTPTR